MEKKLENLKWQPRWISFLGCIKGCLEYLKNGFENWIKALEAGTASTIGTALNAGCWAECRTFGVQFLKEAKERIGGETNRLFDEAAGHYETERDSLHKVAELFPIHLHTANEPIKNSELSEKAIAHLRNAIKAEEAGLKSLEKLCSKLRVQAA